MHADCDDPADGEPCQAARVVEGMFGCEACAGGLAQAAACDGS